MKKILTTLLLTAIWTSLQAQEACDRFRAYLYNKEYDVFLRLDLCGESISVPGQDLYGELPGYFGSKANSFVWLITSAKVKGDAARLVMINDYGSEDLTATLTCTSDSTYTFRQEDGSTLRIPKNGKWQKLPKTLQFKLRR